MLKAVCTALPIEVSGEFLKFLWGLLFLGLRLNESIFFFLSFYGLFIFGFSIRICSIM